MSTAFDKYVRNLKVTVSKLGKTYENLLTSTQRKQQNQTERSTQSEHTKQDEIEDIQPVLTCLTHYTFLQFDNLYTKHHQEQLQQKNHQQKPEADTQQQQQQQQQQPENELQIKAGGNTQFKAFSPHKPDNWIIIESKHNSYTDDNKKDVIHNLLCMGEAKDDVGLQAAMCEVAFKGSFVSPLFSYMCISIAINRKGAEIGLYSPLYRSKLASTSQIPTLIFSQNFVFPTDVPTDADGGPVLVKMINLLNILTSILFKIYITTTSSPSFDQKEWIKLSNDPQPYQTLQTYLLYVKGLQLPRDFGTLCDGIDATSNNVELTQCLVQCLTRYAEQLLTPHLTIHDPSLPTTTTTTTTTTLHPHFLKRTLFRDDIHLTAQQHDTLREKNIEGYQTTYVVGPKVLYQAAASDPAPANFSNPSSQSSTPSPSNMTKSSFKNSQHSSKTVSTNYITLKSCKTDVYYSLISCDCDEEQIFKSVSSDGNVEHLTRNNFLRIGCALYHLHSNGLVHCDIRGPNLVLKTKELNPVLKELNLIDFEYCVGLDEVCDRAKARQGQYIASQFFEWIKTNLQSLKNLHTTNQFNQFFESISIVLGSVTEACKAQQDSLRMTLRFASAMLSGGHPILAQSLRKCFEADSVNIPLVNQLLPQLCEDDVAAKLQAEAIDISVPLDAFVDTKDKVSALKKIDSLTSPQLLRSLDYYGLIHTWFPTLCQDKSLNAAYRLANSINQFFSLDESEAAANTIFGNIFDELDQFTKSKSQSATTTTITTTTPSD